MTPRRSSRYVDEPRALGRCASRRARRRRVRRSRPARRTCPRPSLVVRREDVGHPKHGADVERVGETEALSAAARSCSTYAPKRCLVDRGRPRDVGRSTRAKSVTWPRAIPLRSASRTSPSHLLSCARQLDRRIEEPVVDGANLDGDPRAADVALRRPKSRHALYHMQAPNLRSDKDICQLKNSHRTP